MTVDAAKRYRRSKRGLLVTRYHQQVWRSKVRGLPEVAYSSSELVDKFMDSPAYVRRYDEWVRSGYRRDLKPSIDRINSLKGYTLGNIQVLTYSENLFKQRMENNRFGRDGRREVLQILDGTVVARYRCQKEAVRVTGFKQSPLSKALLGNRKHAYGYEWKYGRSAKEVIDV